MVYLSLDWLSLVGSLSVRQVLDSLRVFDLSDQRCVPVMIRPTGLEPVITWRYCGIRFELSQSVYQMHLGTDFSEGEYEVDGDTVLAADLRFLDVVWDKLRVEFSGSALRYLRDCGLNVDLEFQQRGFFGDPAVYHLTRADFALDFVNCQEDLLPGLVRHIAECRLNGVKRLNNGRPGGLSYYLITGNESTTVELGGRNCPLRCVIYDKKVEQHLGTPYAKQIPYSFAEHEPLTDPDEDGVCYPDIQSWTRVELRARSHSSTNWAETLLYTTYKADKDVDFICPYIDGAVNLISAIHCFRDKFWVRGADGTALPCLISAFSEDSLRNILLMKIWRNPKKTTPVIQKVKNQFDAYWLMIFQIIAFFGYQNFIGMLNEKMRKLYHAGTPNSIRRCRILYDAISEMFIDNPDVLDFHLVKDPSGCYQIRSAFDFR